MFFMIDRVDKMADVMQKGSHLEQEQAVIIQVVKRPGLFKKMRCKFGGQARMLFIELIFTPHVQGRLPRLFPAMWARTA